MPGRELHHGYAFKDTPVIAGASWHDDSTLELIWIFVESAFTDRITCRFSGRQVVVERQVNVNIGMAMHSAQARLLCPYNILERVGEELKLVVRRR